MHEQLVINPGGEGIFEHLCLELVHANRILADHGVVDAFGHVSIRHPENPDQFILSFAKSPELVTRDDLAVFDLNGDLVSSCDGKPYAERVIHAGIYAARGDVNAVVHNHAYEVIPFATTEQKLRPISHFCAPIGAHIDTWDICDHFGDTNLLVTTMEQARSLAHRLAGNRVVLMRGHGSVVVGENVRNAVTSAIYLQVNARMQVMAQQLGEPKFLSTTEVELASEINLSPFAVDRAWEHWLRRVEERVARNL